MQRGFPLRTKKSLQKHAVGLVFRGAEFYGQPGEFDSEKVLKKLKKGFLKNKAAAKMAAKKKELEAKAAEEKKVEAEAAGVEAKAAGGVEAKAAGVEEKPGEVAKKDGELKGKLVRVVEETSAYCGRVLEVTGHVKGKLVAHVAWKDATNNFFESTKIPAKVAIDEKAVIELEKLEKPELSVAKSLRFKDEERAEAEILFTPLELETGHKLGKYRSLPLIHMEMWLWLLSRDFELKKIPRIKLLSPSKMSHICQEMQMPDAAERFVEQVGTLGAELQDAKLIVTPVWGNAPEHWTLLIVEKSSEGEWTVVYKDSLSQMHPTCRENAEKLSTLLACALMVNLKFPADRANKKFQPKGSLECGFYVCHWLEQRVREELGEGLFPIGLPNVGRVFERLDNCSKSIIRNQGWAALHEAKAAKAKESLEKKEADEKQKLDKIVQSAEFQESIYKDNRLKTMIPWVTVSGCSKCKHKPTGSTCCNPEKMLARDLAMAESKDGTLDKDIYKKKLVEVYEKIMKDHISPVCVTKLPEKGGGGKDFAKILLWFR